VCALCCAAVAPTFSSLCPTRLTRIHVKKINRKFRFHKPPGNADMQRTGTVRDFSIYSSFNRPARISNQLNPLLRHSDRLQFVHKVYFRSFTVPRMYKDYFPKWNITNFYCNLTSSCFSEIEIKFAYIMDTKFSIQSTLIQVKCVKLETVLWSFYLLCVLLVKYSF
jgi:hypothetical protein